MKEKNTLLVITKDGKESVFNTKVFITLPLSGYIAVYPVIKGKVKKFIFKREDLKNVYLNGNEVFINWEIK